MKLDPHEQNLAAALKERVEAEFGERLRRVTVFGSRARGEARPDSDLDVLVLLDEAPLTDRFRVYQLAQQVMLEFQSYELAPRVMAEATYAELLERERRLAQDIEREGIPI